jgi:hypothetical protein
MSLESGFATDDPRVQAALDAQQRLQAAMQSVDIEAVKKIFASDLVVNAPHNGVVHRDNVLARLSGGQISYEPGSERKIDFAGVRGGSVVIMGEEIVRPIGDAPHAGKIIRRRFTDIWTEMEGSWRLAVRQATIIAAE